RGGRHPRGSGHAGVRVAAGRPDDADVGAPDGDRVTMHAGIASGRRDPREVLLMDETASRLTPLQWVIAIIAAIGFAFDSYGLLVLPLIVRPALMELLHVPQTSPLINDWVGIIFYVPAVAGGIFGLL